jgi:hypothetical protein
MTNQKEIDEKMKKAQEDWDKSLVIEEATLSSFGFDPRQIPQDTDIKKLKKESEYAR